ncbi:MAG TPA: hypothetical protein VNK04_23845 [Gemmataceae bacterium]|nr:hypothetical protein [Gemmataceae bacterium]
MRPHHPWFRAATNSWYVEIAGQQHLLGKHPAHLPPPYDPGAHGGLLCGDCPARRFRHRPARYFHPNR